MHIFLARHLATVANESGLLMGRTVDAPIKDGSEIEYRKKLQEFRKYFDGKSLKFYSSPRLRCRQTVEIVISELGQEGSSYEVDQRLDETDVGEFSGKTPTEIRESWPKLLDLWMSHPEKIRFPGGESYAEVQERGKEWFNEVLEKEYDVVFCVSHVDVIKMIIFGVLSLPISMKRSIGIDNGSLSIFSKREEELVLVGFNLS